MKAALLRRFRRTGAIAVAFLALAAGAAGAPQRPGNAGSPCTTASGLPGTTVVWTSSSGVVTSWCQYAPAIGGVAGPGPERDRLRPGRGRCRRIRRAVQRRARPGRPGRTGSGSGRRRQRERVPAAAGERRARRRRLPRRARRCAERLPRRDRPLRHALRRRDRRALLRRRDRPSLHRPVRAPAGRGHGASSVGGRLEHRGRLAPRIPNGSDTDDAATDWTFTRTPTPGAANVP